MEAKVVLILGGLISGLVLFLGWSYFWGGLIARFHCTSIYYYIFVYNYWYCHSTTHCTTPTRIQVWGKQLLCFNYTVSELHFMALHSKVVKCN